MQLVDGAVLYSASDLVVATECEFAAARRIEESLGLIPSRQESVDALMERAARLGDAHEARILAAKQDRYGPGVVQIPVRREALPGWTRRGGPRSPRSATARR